MTREPELVFDGACEPHARRGGLGEDPDANPWQRLRVTFDPRCQAPLLLVASFIARRAVEVRSARFDSNDGERQTFEATVRGRGRRLRTVERSLQSRAEVLDATLCPVVDGDR